MILCIMIQRRDFCIGLFAAIAATAACRERVARLKVPEDADECVDLFRYFTDPGFGFEQAKVGLNVSGEPDVRDDDYGKLFTFENQSEPVKSIRLGTMRDKGSGELRLAAIYIYYQRPIEVSLMRLQSFLGESIEQYSKSARQRGPAHSSHGFSPDNPIAPGHLKGGLLFESEAVEKDIKHVNWLRYQRNWS